MFAVQTNRIRSRQVGVVRSAVAAGATAHDCKRQREVDLAAAAGSAAGAPMNVERLLRDVDRRLQACDESLRAEVRDAVREAIARERRFAASASFTVEGERERRIEAEQLRGAVDAIGRPASTEAALAEAVK